jgi:hypothetical protein
MFADGGCMYSTQQQRAQQGGSSGVLLRRRLSCRATCAPASAAAACRRGHPSGLAAAAPSKQSLLAHRHGHTCSPTSSNLLGNTRPCPRLNTRQPQPRQLWLPSIHSDCLERCLCLVCRCRPPPPAVFRGFFLAGARRIRCTAAHLPCLPNQHLSKSVRNHPRETPAAPQRTATSPSLGVVSSAPVEVGQPAAPASSDPAAPGEA